VRAGRFREDLYYRLTGITLNMPPLRERVGDIPPLARRLLREVGAELGRPGVVWADDAMGVLMGYPWPGNIRELRNEIARAIALSDGERIEARAFSTRVLHGQAGRHAAAQGQGQVATLPQTGTLQERLDAIEAVVLREVMLRLRWNRPAPRPSWGCRGSGCGPSCSGSGWKPRRPEVSRWPPRSCARGAWPGRAPDPPAR